MGTILKVICHKCGFSRPSIFYGTGMIEAPARIPAIRKDTGELVEAEFSDDPNLQFYHQREMYKDALKEDHGIQNAEIWLNPKGNLCPSCQEFTMEFESIGNWD